MIDWGVRQHDHSQQEQGCRKGPWTSEEDKLLAEYVTLHGEGRWSTVAKCAGLNRSGKSCRLRWVNYLRPGLKRGQLTPREEGIILELHSLWGNKWSTIARYLPGRTDNEIKNYWRTHYKKKEKSTSSMLGKIKSSKFRKQSLDLKQQAHTHSQLLSQNLTYLDNKQSIQDLSFSYSTGLFSDQSNMAAQNVGATSSDHSAVDEGNYWCNLWNLDNNVSLGFDGGSEQRTTTNIAKFNNGGTEAPLCGSWNQKYDGFYAEGYIF